MQTIVWLALSLALASPQSNVLLRSLDWIADYGAHAGGSVFLDMPEMGVEGQSEVLAIEPCPPLESGEGRLVTGTFKHTSGEVYDLKLESESKPLGVTATHPFWSVDREAWVSAIDLEIGERLKTLAGTTVVESRRKRDEPETVYNIEVEGDHCYRVGESGVLVHNNSADPCDCLPTVEFSLSGSMPDVAANIQAAQQAGHPNLLHRITSRSAIRRNRRQACGSVTCASGESCDEYPFASSQEGGTGARTQCVPAGQQNSQGGTLSSFYSSNGIGDGDSYCVKVVQ